MYSIPEKGARKMWLFWHVSVERPEDCMADSQETR
jgi:hypothetical protein